MKLPIAHSVLFIYFACATYTEGAESALKQYEVPVQITQIEWILIKAEVRSLSRVQYDTLGLVADVSLSYSSGRVFVTVSVASAPFRNTARAALERIFTDVLIHAERTLKREIPEIDLKQNIIGLFLELNGSATKEVAGWQKGKLYFYKD